MNPWGLLVILLGILLIIVGIKGTQGQIAAAATGKPYAGAPPTTTSVTSGQASGKPPPGSRNA